MGLREKIEERYFEQSTIERKSEERCKKEAEEIVFAERAKKTSKVIQSVGEMNEIQELIKVKAKQIRTENRMTIRAELNKKEDEFKAELEEENGLSEHPKKDLLYALVRREIDPGNLIDFMNSYEEFAQLLDKE